MCSHHSMFARFSYRTRPSPTADEEFYDSLGSFEEEMFQTLVRRDVRPPFGSSQLVVPPSPLPDSQEETFVSAPDEGEAAIDAHDPAAATPPPTVAAAPAAATAAAAAPAAAPAAATATAARAAPTSAPRQLRDGGNVGGEGASGGGSAQHQSGMAQLGGTSTPTSPGASPTSPPGSPGHVPKRLRAAGGLKSTQRQTGEAFMVGVHGGAVQVARIITRVERAPGFSA